MKRLIAIVLSLFFFLSFAMPAFADSTALSIIEETASIRNIEIRLAKADIEINGKTATCTSFASAASSDTSLRAKMSLQQKTENGWKTVASWSASGTGPKGVTLSKTKRWLASGSYRVCLSVSAYDGSRKFIETKTVYSAIKSV